MKLHLGCGSKMKEGWNNLDINPPAWATKWIAPLLPFEDESIDFIYSEHFIEHLTREDGQRLFLEAKRCLKPGKVMRISTPNLPYICYDYLNQYEHGIHGKYAEVDFHYKTPAEFINRSFRDWDHLYLYDQREISILANIAGFSSVLPARHDPSLETRPFIGDLIMEFKK